MRLSVIISTYNAPLWLEKVLWGYAAQDYTDFELLIADDGSRDDTRALIARMRQLTPLTIRHIRHEDTGFQKSRILNAAVRHADTDYLLFSDGDCIPRRDFVGVHARYAEPGRFLSGGYFKLPLAVSSAITREDVEAGRIFEARWLFRQGVPITRKYALISLTSPLAQLCNRITTTRPTWNGHNASGWKADILRVNGYDERMQYGGQDRELGERLVNAGIKPRQIRYCAICVHLDHPRGYKVTESLERNRGIRQATRSERKVWTPFGIEQAPADMDPVRAMLTAIEVAPAPVPDPQEQGTRPRNAR